LPSINPVQASQVVVVVGSAVVVVVLVVVVVVGVMHVAQLPLNGESGTQLGTPYWLEQVDPAGTVKQLQFGDPTEPKLQQIFSVAPVVVVVLVVVVSPHWPAQSAKLLPPEHL
jgi:hypothetical protein